MSQQPIAEEIYTVIVLYGESAENSRTVGSLKQAFAEAPELIPHFATLLYDNSRDPQAVPPDLLPGEFEISQAARNQGLSAAYNEALRRTEERGMPWLLLLDSDTQITSAFLRACVKAARLLKEEAEVGAAIPHVVEESAIHSPRYIRGVRRRPVPLSWEGVFPHEIVALNSGSLVRVSAIRNLGGFNDEFWLDYLDYWLFRAMQRGGFKVYVLSEKIDHSLTFADPTKRMPVERYQNMLDAERFFTVRYGTPGERIRLRILLLKRAAELCLKPNGKPYVRALLTAAFRLSSGARPPLPPAE